MIVHICPAGSWRDAVGAGEYRPASLIEEGFIHLSTPAQVLPVANAFFQGQRGLLLLWIDESRLDAPLRWELPAPALPDPGHPGPFPHLYGPLALAAVAAAMPFEPDSDGVFRAVPVPSGAPQGRQP